MTLDSTRPEIPPLQLTPKEPFADKKRRTSLGDAKSAFSRSVKNITGNIPPLEIPTRHRRTLSNGAVEDQFQLDVPVSPRDPTASPRVIESVDNFFAYYYQKYPLSRAEQKELATKETAVRS